MSELRSKLNEEKVVRIAMEMNPATKPYWSTCAPLLDLGTLCPAALTPRGWLAYMGSGPGDVDRMLAELESMSDQQAEQLLERENG